MNCQECRDAIFRLETPGLPPDVQGHAASCPSCQALVQGHIRLQRGLPVLKKAAAPPELSQRVMKRLAAEPTDHVAPLPLWEKILKLFLPGSPWRSSLVYGIAGTVILVLCFGILFLGRRGPTVPGRAPTPLWEVSLLEGAAPTDFPELNVPSRTAGAEAGRILHFGPDTVSRMQMARKADVSLKGAWVTLTTDGFQLERGQATVEVHPGSLATPFRIDAGLAEVTVIGTRFHLDRSIDRLRVQVQEGKVRVAAPKGERILGPGLEAVVGPDGFQPPPTHGAATPTVTHPGVTTPGVGTPTTGGNSRPEQPNE